MAYNPNPENKSVRELYGENPLGDMVWQDDLRKKYSPGPIMRFFDVLVELRGIFALLSWFTLMYFLTFEWFPREDYPEMLAKNYWMGMAYGYAISFIVSVIVFCFADMTKENDLARKFMSPAGKFVWDNYADLNIITGMLKKRMND